MTLGKFRSLLYKAARVTGDVQAVRKGRIGKRIRNRAIARVGFKMMRKLWR